MSWFFDSVLCCCSKRNSEDSFSGEREHLLPTSDEPSLVSYNATAFEERLNHIVKAKEGKMVRVLARAPFNLRNNSGLASTSESRSTRSPSANLSFNNGSEQTPMGRHSSSRRPPSPSISRSESTSSIQQASMSRIPLDDTAYPYSEYRLRVKLIPSAKSNQRIFSRRGRSKTRQGRFREDSENAPTLEGIQSVDSGRFDSNDPESHTPNGIGNARKTGAASPARPEVTSLSEEDSVAIRAISNELASTLKESFEDIGMLTRSWGD